jgi:hypothetical protein
VVLTERILHPDAYFLEVTLMSPLLTLGKWLLSTLIPFLMLQMSAMPPDPGGDPITKATTPPAQFLVFNADFSSMDKARFMQWINPNRGLVKNGILLTKDETDKDFSGGKSGKSSMKDLKLVFNYGEFSGANCFQADCQVQYTANVDGDDKSLQFHNIFVFEIIDGVWNLVQSEFVMPETNVAFSVEKDQAMNKNVPPELQNMVQYSRPVYPGMTPWPLLIGTNFLTEQQLQPVEGKTTNGRTWSLSLAKSQHKPAVLFMTSVHSLSMIQPSEFKAQMDFVSSLYDTFGRQSLYIFAVTDERKEEIDWIAESGYNKFAWLLDEGSKMHTTLNIDTHPYIVIFDAEGSVVAIDKSYHPSSWNLIKDRIRGVIAKAGA